MLIALINDNSNLMIIKTYQSLLLGEYIFTLILSKSHTVYSIAFYVCYTFHNKELKNIQRGSRVMFIFVYKDYLI